MYAGARYPEVRLLLENNELSNRRSWHGSRFTQLSLQERRRIEDWWLAKVPVAEMARVLKRHKSTIFREIKRNFWADDVFPKKYEGYFGMQAEIGTQMWFCDPSSPWQKGTVENTNRRARRWLPRKRDITAASDHELKMTCDRLNATPRKCLEDAR